MKYINAAAVVACTMGMVVAALVGNPWTFFLDLGLVVLNLTAIIANGKA